MTTDTTTDSMPSIDALRARALAILAENDRGGYTVPTAGLYPFQWNWDSCLVALGLAHESVDRALLEIETLLAHQWPDGMVPHIVFHADHETYFPGPGVWNTRRPVPTSGITQPPILAFCLARLFDRARGEPEAVARIDALVERAAAWHRWFFAVRDPDRSGLVAILHPWESGRDNSIDWDAALARVPDEGVDPYVRRDTALVDAAHRPTKAEYDRYLWLVQRFRDLGWDQAVLHEASPFKVVDPGINAVLIRSCEELSRLARALGRGEIAEEAAAQAARGRAALETLWDEARGLYVPFDRASGEHVPSASIGGLMPLLALEPGDPRATRLVARLEGFLDALPHGLANHDPADPRFDGKRYWRGPAWPIANLLVIDALLRHGATETARRLARDTVALCAAGDFPEYVDPRDGSPCGGGRFSWSAAAVLEITADPRLADMC